MNNDGDDGGREWSEALLHNIHMNHSKLQFGKKIKNKEQNEVKKKWDFESN